MADHHLITRLSENNGHFSFAAQVRLDFEATDEDGNLIWDAQDLVVDALARQTALADSVNTDDGSIVSDGIVQTDLVNGLLPGEGDFLVIIIDALDGNDRIEVGPTVQKSVWVDAGAGDDYVEIAGGSSILVDLAEVGVASDTGLRGRNDRSDQAFDLVSSLTTAIGSLPAGGAFFTGLTIDNPGDVDWFTFELAADTIATDTIEVASAGLVDELTLSLFASDNLETPVVENIGSLAFGAGTLTANTEYLLKVESKKSKLEDAVYAVSKKSLLRIYSHTYTLICV